MKSHPKVSNTNVVIRKVQQDPEVNRRLIELEFDLDETYVKKRQEDPELVYKKQTDQSVYNKRILLVDYNKEKPNHDSHDHTEQTISDEILLIEPIKQKRTNTVHKKASTPIKHSVGKQDENPTKMTIDKMFEVEHTRTAERTGQPLPTLKPRSQTKNKSTKSKSKSKTPKKTTLTPPMEGTDMLKKLIPTINDKAFYHNICKRPVDTLNSRSARNLTNTSPSRRMVKSRSVPKLKDNFYDKKVEFYVQMYKKLENTTYKPDTQKMSSDTILRNTQKIKGLQDTISRYNKDTQTSVKPQQKNHVHPIHVKAKTPELKSEQFCNFCDNYFHEKCFDDYYRHNK